MLKSTAVAAFGGSNKMARALGVSKGYVSLWPDVLTDRQRREVVGALIESGQLRLTKASAEKVLYVEQAANKV